MAGRPVGWQPPGCWRGTYLAGVGTLLGLFRAAFGAGFRFCVWPVGRLASGNSQEIVRAHVH